MPKLGELASIADVAREDPAIVSTAAFPNTPSTIFWAASSSTGNSNFALGVSFYNGKVMSFRTFTHYLRLVRDK